MSTTSLGVWEESNYTSFMLWDIDREFQNACEAYEQMMAKSRRRKTRWQCIAGSKKEDPLEEALSLGRQVQKVFKEGKALFGSRFEKGDSTCHTILSAQLLRLQREIHAPLQDCTEPRIRHSHISLPTDTLLLAAHSIRRATLHALRDQTSRLKSRPTLTILPPPRFSIEFCPYAIQLQTDHRKQNQNHRSVINARKLHPKDRYDDREICPGCNVQIAVAAHSGLPGYRRLLFASHTALPPSTANMENRATFACEGCYKTFDESYAFLDHVWEKEVGGQRSCLRKWSGSVSSRSTSMTGSGKGVGNNIKRGSQFSFASEVFRGENEAALVEMCLRNCLQREWARSTAAIPLSGTNNTATTTTTNTKGCTTTTTTMKATATTTTTTTTTTTIMNL